MLNFIKTLVENLTGLLVGLKMKSLPTNNKVFILFYTDVKYHNKSSFEMTDNSEFIDQEEKKREEERRRKEE